MRQGEREVRCKGAGERASRPEKSLLAIFANPRRSWRTLLCDLSATKEVCAMPFRRSFQSAVLLALAIISCASFARSTSAEGREAPSTSPDERYLLISQLRQRYGDEDGRIAKLRGMEIYYKDEGPRDAPVLFMVHGSTSNLRTWDKIVARMKGRYRIVRFDVGGMGLSGRISDKVAASVYPVQIAKGLLDKLKIRHVSAYVGVSSGGTLGMYLAAEYPGLIDRLVLSNTPSDKLSYQHMVQPQSFLDAQAQVAREGGFQSRHFWDEYLSYFAGDPARFDPQLRDEYYDMNRRTPEAHPIALVARIDDGVEAHRKMKQITIPTLLVWGGADKLLTLDAMHALEAHLENARVSRVILPDVGHYPPVEAPERFERILSAYIDAGVLAKAD